MARTIRKDGEPLRVTTDVGPEGSSRTKQSFAGDCDINNIMGAWSKTGETHHVNSRAPQWGDFSECGDYQSAQNQVIEAREMFNSMPSDTRYRFHNNPAELLAFVQDPANLEEAYDLELIDRPGDFPEPIPTEGPAPQGETASEGETPSPS